MCTGARNGIYVYASNTKNSPPIEWLLPDIHVVLLWEGVWWQYLLCASSYLKIRRSLASLSQFLPQRMCSRHDREPVRLGTTVRIICRLELTYMVHRYIYMHTEPRVVYHENDLCVLCIVREMSYLHHQRCVGVGLRVRRQQYISPDTLSICFLVLACWQDNRCAWCMYH